MPCYCNKSSTHHSGCVGAGDVAGVLSEKGVSEKVIDDGLDSVDEGGNELRVPDGEPLGVNITCRSIVLAVRGVN